MQFVREAVPPDCIERFLGVQGGDVGRTSMFNSMVKSLLYIKGGSYTPKSLLKTLLLKIRKGTRFSSFSSSFFQDF